MFRFASTLDQAAARYLAVGTGAVEPAGYYYAGTLRAAPRQARDGAFTAALWDHLGAVVARGALASGAAGAGARVAVAAGLRPWERPRRREMRESSSPREPPAGVPTRGER